MIHKLSYVDFLALPCERREGRSIANVWFKNGKKWVAVFRLFPDKRISEMFSPPKLSPTTFLDFYNLDIANTDTGLEFMAQHHITYIDECYFDEESGALIFTIVQLRRYHQWYKYDFDWVIDEEGYSSALSKEFEEIKKAGGAKSSCGCNPIRTFHRVEEQLEKCHPTWRQTPGEQDWENYHYKDFIALCYLQLTLADKTKIIICPECNHKFVADPKQLGRPRKYCSDSCAKAHKKKNDTRYILSLVNTENLATTEFDPQLAVVFDIRCRSTKGNERSPNVSQDRVNWTSTMADRILPVGNGGVLGSSKSMSKMRVNLYRDRAKSFYQRYVICEKPIVQKRRGNGNRPWQALVKNK